MGKLIYSAISSLDGYIEDKAGKFGWAEPDEEVHGFVNDLEREAKTYLYGRRMYQTMQAWEAVPTTGALARPLRDFAGIWQAAEKIVFSRTLDRTASARTRIEHTFEPELIRQLKASIEADILIGGPNQASHAFKAGLVDQLHLFLLPIIVGGGKKTLPDDLTFTLQLEVERRFSNGTVFLRYRAMI